MSRGRTQITASSSILEARDEIALNNGDQIKCVLVNRPRAGTCVEVDARLMISETFLLTLGSDDLVRLSRGLEA